MDYPAVDRKEMRPYTIGPHCYIYTLCIVSVCIVVLYFCIAKKNVSLNAPRMMCLGIWGRKKRVASSDILEKRSSRPTVVIAKVIASYRLSKALTVFLCPAIKVHVWQTKRFM